MNWLIREKMFTYFYDKFRPVSRMHYTKCGVNCSLLTQFWMLQKVCATLDHCFSRHTVFTKRELYYKFTFVWYSAKQGTTHRPTSHLAHLYTAPFLWPWQAHIWQRSWVDDFAGQCLCTSVQVIIKESSVRTLLPSWEKCTVTKCYVYIGVCGGV